MDTGRRQSLLGESRLVVLHRGASLSFSRSTFPENETLLRSKICDQIWKGKSIPFEIYSASEEQVSFQELLDIFGQDDEEKNTGGGEYYFVIVRTTKNGGETVPNMEDFNQTDIPMARQSRIPKGFIETREVYEPEVAFEEFIDNAIQYVQNSPVKIISATIAPSENRISFLDTGEGIRYDDIQKWATPAEPTTVVTPVPWTHQNRSGKNPSLVPIVTVGRSNPEMLKTLQSHPHDEQFGVLNWWGLGGKLAAANLGGQNSQLILKTKPKSGKPGKAVVKPGIWSYEVGQLSESEFPNEDVIKRKGVHSFIEFTIANADVQRLLKDTRLQDYEKKLNLEFCNVYYPYLVGVDQVAARIKVLNEANLEEHILGDPIPWDLPEELGGPQILLNRKLIDPRKCFVHRCLSKARCAFSFRLEFPMEVGHEHISYEINTTVLYFPAREGAPNFDERISRSFDSKQTFAFWNGKLMFNHEIDFITEWKLKSEIANLLDLERRIRIFVHFSRTFKPKQNKEGIDDREALAKYRSIASNLKNSVRDEIIAFLKNCHSIDGKSELIFENGKVVAVAVAGKSQIWFGKHYDITLPAPKKQQKATIYPDCIFSNGSPRARFSPFLDDLIRGVRNLVDDQNLATDALLIGCYPSLDGDEPDKKYGVMFKIVRVSAKSIGRAEASKFGLEDTKTKPYVDATPKKYVMKYFRREKNEEVKTLRSGDFGVDAHVFMANAAGANIFEAQPAQGMSKKVIAYVDSLREYMKDTKPNLEIEFDPSSPHKPIVFSWNQELLCWTGGVDSLMQQNRSVWQMNLICRPSGAARKPHIFTLLTTPLKIEIAEGQAAVISIEDLPQEIVLGSKVTVTFVLKDRQSRPVTRAIQELLGVKLHGAPHVKIQQSVKWEAGKGSFDLIFTGKLPEKAAIKLELTYSVHASQSIPIAIKPAPVKVISLVDPPKLDDLLNNSMFSCGVTGQDSYGNPVSIEGSIYIDGDLVTKPERQGAAGVVEFNVNAWLFLPEVEPRVFAKQIVYPELHASLRDYRIPTFVDHLDSGAAVFCSHFDFLVEGSKDKVRCFPGDAVWFKSSGREHLVRIHSFKRTVSGVVVSGSYFFAANCDAEFVADLKQDEAVMSSRPFEARVDAVKYWGKVWIMSLGAYRAVKNRNINFGEVKFCRRMYISPRKFIQLDVGATPQEQEEIRIIAGHQDIGTFSVDFRTQAEIPLLQHEGLKLLLQKNRIILESPGDTIVTSYAATYGGHRIRPTTKIGDLVLNSEVPLLISADRGSLDEYNQTLRIAIASQKKVEEVLTWTDYRVLVKPSTKPYSLHIQCQPSADDDRAAWEWVTDFSTLSSRCKLRASVNVVAQFELSVLSESGVQCDVDGIASLGSNQFPIKGGKGLLTVNLPHKPTELVFKFQALSRIVDFLPELPAPMAIDVSAKPLKCGDQMRMGVTFHTETGDLTRLPSDVAQRHVTVSLFRINQDGSTMPVRVKIAKFSHSDLSLTADEHVISRAGIELSFRVVVTDRGFVMSKDFSVIVGAGAPSDLQVKPKNGIKMESGVLYDKDIRITAVDAAGNPSPLTQGIMFRVPDHIVVYGSATARPDASGEAILPKGTLMALKSGQDIITITGGLLSKEIPLEVVAGHAPVRMVAGLVHAGVQSDSVTVSAGYYTSHITVVADIFDERDELWTLEQPQLTVTTPRARPFTLPLGSPILGDTPSFMIAGEYKILVSLNSPIWGRNVASQQLSIQVTPARPTIWLVTCERQIRATLNQPFLISGKISDQYTNPASVTVRLVTGSSILDVDFVDPNTPDVTMAEADLPAVFQAWVVASLKTGSSLPHDEAFDLHLAPIDGDTELFGDVKVIVAAQEAPPTRKRARAETTSRVTNPPAPGARAQKIAATNNEARNAELRRIRDFLRADSVSKVNYNQSNASFFANTRPVADLLCPGYELVYVKWPDHWLPTLEGKPIEFWRSGQTELSRYVTFLNSIVIYNNNYDEYRATQQNFMNTVLQGKKVKYSFVQVRDGDSKLLTIVRPRDQRDKDLVDLSSLLWVSDTLPDKVRSGIISWLRSKCPRWKVCLTKEVGAMYENKINDTFLCLESGTVHRPASQHAEIEGTSLDLHGPRIRFAADREYLRKLSESVGDYE